MPEKQRSKRGADDTASRMIEWLGVILAVTMFLTGLRVLGALGLI